MNPDIQAYCDSIVPGKIKFHDMQLDGPLAVGAYFEWLPAREFGGKLPIRIPEQIVVSNYKEICDEVIRRFQQWQIMKENENKEAE